MEGRRTVRIVLVTKTFADNQLGRAHSLYLAARTLGYDVSVVTTSAGEVWGPLRGSEFACVCTVVTPEALRPIAKAADLIVAVKTLPESLGVAMQASSQAGVPILADVDDPDVEADLFWGPEPVRSFLGAMRRPARVLGLLRARQLAKRLPTMVSNPVLQELYGGEIVPHARRDTGVGREFDSDCRTVAFVGTTRGHKGVDLLRAAIRLVAADGWRLVVTADPPPDCRPWEDWVGQTSQEAGMQLVRDADVVIVPSRPYGYSRGQLPMKLIDAMLAGRAVAVSGVGPLPWAVGDAGLVFRPDSAEDIRRTLVDLGDVGLRRDLGQRARRLALSRYTPEAVAPALEGAVLSALGGR
jgi:glycosyltransferase involved in cell wall biosynthesis